MKFDDVVQEKKKRFRSPFEEDSKKDLKSFMTEKDFISTQFYNVNRWIFDKKKAGAFIPNPLQFMWLKLKLIIWWSGFG